VGVSPRILPLSGSSNPAREEFEIRSSRICWFSLRDVKNSNKASASSLAVISGPEFFTLEGIPLKRVQHSTCENEEIDR
jgi:hypothetical protein